MEPLIWGMPTLLELNGIEENIDLCQSLRLNFIELNMNLPEYQPGRIDFEKFNSLKDKNEIFYTIHLPEEFDIANFNEDISDAYKKIFVESVDIAKRLSIPVINMHMNVGVFFTMPTERIYLYEKYNPEYLDKIKRFAAFSTELLKNSGVKLAVENTGIYDLMHIKVAVDELINHDHIMLTWDIGHDFSSGYKDYEYIQSKKYKLGHMHIHDAIGKNNHLPLFTGELDMEDRLKVAREHGCRCVIETKTVEGLKESVVNLRAKGVMIG